MIKLYQLFFLLSIIGLFAFFICGATYIIYVFIKQKIINIPKRVLLISFSWYLIFFILFMVVQQFEK